MTDFRCEPCECGGNPACTKCNPERYVRLPLDVDIACRTPKNHPDRFGPEPDGYNPANGSPSTR